LRGIDQVGGGEAFRERRVGGVQYATSLFRITPLALRTVQPDRSSELRADSPESPIPRDQAGFRMFKRIPAIAWAIFESR
jgi:hypothetical protein